MRRESVDVQGNMEIGPGNSNSNNGFRRSRGVNWTEEETEQLLEAWSQREVQNLLENGPHNRQAFERVSFNLAQHNMDKTPSQCREKIKKLKSIYRSMTGQGKATRQLRGRLMQKLHQVMGGLSTNMSTASKEPDLIPTEQEGHNVSTEERQTAGVISDDFHATFPESITSNTDYMMDEEHSSSSSDQSVSSSDEDDTETGQLARNTAIKTTRRKSTRKSRRKSLNTLYVLIDKLIAAQNAASERFAALEEKRLTIDKELEEKRIEAEERRQEAQRQHELRLLSTVAQQMGNVFKSLNPSPFAGRCDAAVASEPSDKPHQVNGCDDYPTAAVYSNI